MSEIIFIAQSVSADKAGYEFLSEFYDSIRTLPTVQIEVNFEKCKKFDANLSAVLGACLNKMEEDGYKIELKIPKYAGVKRALSRNKFFEAFGDNTPYLKSEKYIEYKKFKITDANAFKEYVEKELIQNEFFPTCSQKAKEKIVESIYEIFANAEHSECDSVYCCGELNKRNGKNILDITLVSLGKSVIENVNDFMRRTGNQEISPCKTLEWAFIEGNTTKEVPGGLGLAILKEFIGMNEGSIQMVSGNAMIEISGDDPIKTSLNKWFPGTIVTVEFNCDDEKAYITTDEAQNRNIL